MSWTGTYTHTLAFALDLFGAALIFNRPGGVTISSLARIAHLASEDVDNGIWRTHLASLHLWNWQYKFLLWVAARLGEDHCEGARVGDITRAHSAMQLLGAFDLIRNGR